MDWQAHRREAHALGRAQEYLKQITYGGNDGIVTTFAIVAGFAGASAEGAGAVGALPDEIVEGRFLESVDDRGIVIGARLAERLETRLGKRVVIMSQDPDNDIADRGARTGLVVEVMDQVQAGGINRISISTDEQAGR